MTEPTPSPRRPAGAASGATARADAAARAARLVARLEQQIAATPDQRVVLTKAFEHPVVVEPHRDHHAYVLGSDLFYCGLASGDGLAMMGLMSVGPARLARLLAKAAVARPHVYVARLWPIIIDANRAEYEARGRYVSWQRRWAVYKEEADGWAARDPDADAGWRELPMTSGQRHLVQDCAILGRVDLPEGMDRGQAHDWLKVNGANAIYRKDA